MEKKDYVIEPRLPRVLILPEPFERLKLYIELCPWEVSGLGIVDQVENDFVIRDIFITRQWNYSAFTEMYPEDLSRVLIEMVKEGKDPNQIKLWWHSHAGMDVFWSQIDDYTSRNLGQYLISLVGNKAGKFRCRLDVSEPVRLTVDNLSFEVNDGHPASIDHGRLRHEVEKEIWEKVQSLNEKWEGFGELHDEHCTHDD